jgi:hypothetical protein
MVDLAGEWQFINTITAPPASGQMRLNHATQTSATKMWVSKTPATSGDASAALAAILKGMEVTIKNKADPTKTQVYTVSNTPVDATGYFEYPVVWTRGNGPIPEQRTLISAVTVTASVAVEVAPMKALKACTPVHTDVSGQLITFDFAYPFEGLHLMSPGMTLRQYYAAQAMLGFIAGSNVPASNLVGKVAAFAFTAADSMIAFEAKERAGYLMPVAGSDRNAPATSVTIPEVDDGASLRPPPASPTTKAVWPRKIIS